MTLDRLAHAAPWAGVLLVIVAFYLGVRGAVVRIWRGDEDEVVLCLRASKYANLDIRGVAKFLNEELSAAGGEVGAYGTSPGRITFRISGPDLETVIDAAARAARARGLTGYGYLRVFPERGRTKSYRIPLDQLTRSGA